MTSTLPVRESRPQDDDLSSNSSSDGSDVFNTKAEEGWEDVEPDVEEEQIVSLLDGETFPTVQAMLAYCKDKYNFDFLELRDKFSLDFYGSIKLVNFIRSAVKDNGAPPSNIRLEDFDKDDFLKPVIADDALLFNLDELPPAQSETASQQSGDKALVDRIAQLEEELKRTQSHFEDYRALATKTLDDRWNDSSKAVAGPAENAEEKRDDDSHYFSSYSYNDIHETMLKDTVRTDAYRDFIYNNKHLFKGKTVLDVGCGTGILSMFCAKAGAARVIAVDNSAIIDKARENIFNNGFADVITCLRGKVEEVVLPVDKVDIIVSEWMGYFLLYEAMLDSVLWARDKYLRPDGLMVPSHMNMWVAPVADPEFVADHFTFWRDVYGFDMKAMQAGIHEEAHVLHMPTKTICGEPFPFLQLELHTTTVKDLTFTKEFKSKLTQNIDSLDGFDIWFDTFFAGSRDEVIPRDARAETWQSPKPGGVAFTTGPYGKETHWRQGVVFIDNDDSSKAHKEGEVVTGTLQYAVADDNSRALDVKFDWKFDNEEKKHIQSWRMR